MYICENKIYIEKQKEKQEIEEIKNNLGKEIISLRDMIDFKELSNFFILVRRVWKL